MRNVYYVIKNEIVTTLSKRSYWVMTFLFPALILMINIGTQVITQNALKNDQKMIPSGADKPIGYVDHSGLIKKLPANIPPALMKAYPDENAAQAALEAGDLQSYAVIPDDYLKTGKLLLVEREFKPLGGTPEKLFQYIITYNITGDEALTTSLADPLSKTQSHRLAPQTGTDKSSPMTLLVSLATLFLFFFLLTNSSSLMLQSVAGEKENRTAEVMLLSLNPKELMLGKVLGLGAVALVQMFLWVGGGMLLLSSGQQLIPSISGFSFPQGFPVYALLYFLLGFLMYASLMGAIGALAPTAREGSQFTIVVLLPLMLPVFLNTIFTETPDSAIAVVFSLIPFTAPTSMMARLVGGHVQLWQLAVSLGGLAITAYGALLLSARFFRADTLLSSAALKWSRLLGELRRT